MFNQNLIIMSQQINSIQKQLVIILSRFGQIVGVYATYDDAEIVIKDTINKGQILDVSIKYVQ